ncbi:O-antigen translocase [Pontibacter korlensis]|uniref:O-antigen translocase n=1 Tax=Pontibacter korlensis TaxID=400092 RepID=A0A0E3UUP8_9BACT|nr:O-antigen translocase [Pontibacter korlensis]AKD01952.1 O-antigen translocase [Pontibacter korlensis]
MSKVIARGREGAYRKIFKATSIYGGVQVFNIIITIIRTKLVAVLLGPSGMGIVSLLTTTTGFIGAITNFGLSTSAVKNVSAAFSTGNSRELAVTVAVFRRLVWFTGLLGFVLTLALAPWLSKIVFDNREYTYAFFFVAVTLLLTQVSAGQGVILRGTRKLDYMAKSSVIGAVAGLVVSVPFYYFLGEDGIVPAIILTSLSALLVTWYFSRKVDIPSVEVSTGKVLGKGKQMLKMGFLISLSGLITLGVSNFVRIYISNKGGLAEVGLYNAGFAIIGTYVGMVFTAMGTDYYPRLAAVAHDKHKSNLEINQQAEIALLILAPILMVFLVYIEWAIILLYSKKFSPITGMIHWAALGIFFKAVGWAIGFLILAKGASRVFFWNEIVANAFILGLNIVGYNLFGLTGLGVSFLFSYLIYFLQVYILCKYLYALSLSIDLIKVFVYQFVLALACFTVVQLLEKKYAYPIGTVFILVSVLFSWVQLNKRLGLIQIIKKVLTKLTT